jgi:hypothetical protein
LLRNYVFLHVTTAGIICRDVRTQKNKLMRRERLEKRSGKGKPVKEVKRYNGKRMLEETEDKR